MSTDSPNPTQRISTASKRPNFSLDGSQSQKMVNSHLKRSRKMKGDRTRRCWTDREDEALVLALKDIVADKWKSDNGFRDGYLSKLEDIMKSKFPLANIKGTPHITSKISAWKKNYGSLGKILDRSGVGFNLKDDYKIDCDDDQWDQIVKADPSARCMRGKSWPYWEHWQVIFGKDRANGGTSEDLMESVNELYSLDNMQASFGAGVQPASLDGEPTDDPLNDTPAAEGVGDSTGQSTHVTDTTNSGKKKAKTDQGIDGLLCMLDRLHEDTNSRLDKLSLRIGYEFDLSKARQDVYKLLGRLPGLTRDQKFDVGEIILAKVERLDFFLGMPDEDRVAYVFRALAKFG